LWCFYDHHKSTPVVGPSVAPVGLDDRAVDVDVGYPAAFAPMSPNFRFQARGTDREHVDAWPPGRWPGNVTNRETL